MQFDFGRPDLRELYFEKDFDGGHPPEVVSAYRDCMQLVGAAASLDVLAVFRDVNRLEAGRYAIHLQGNAVLTVFKKEGNPTDVVIIQSLDRMSGDGHDR